MHDFIIIFITLPPIAFHETTQEQVVPHLYGIRVHKAPQLASSTQTSYLRLVLLKHLGLRGAQNLFTMPSVIVRTMVAWG
eukprot:UN18518